MGIFAWIAIGCLVGILAGFLPPRSEVLLARLCIGVGGGVVGGWIGARAFGADPVGITTLRAPGLIGALLGAVLLNALHVVLARREERLRRRARPKATVDDIDDYRPAA